MRIDEKLKVIYETIAPTITRSEEAWKDYLRFSSTVYKHPFDSALLVYAQKPKATMLASFDTWTSEKVGRSINRGEKGIAVCDYQSDNLTVKHLFDVTQTNGKKMPPIWKMDDELKAGLLKRLSQSRGISADNLTDCIGQLVANNIADNIDSHLKNFEDDVKDHFLGDMPHDGLVVELVETIYNSCVYYIANRCGETADTTMPTISHFDTLPLIQRLGYTVTELSKSILLEIERNIKILESERSAKNERIIREQGTPSPNQQFRDRGRTGSAPRQVRQNGDETLARNRPAKVFTFEDARRAYEPDVSGGRGSDSESRIDQPKAVGERPDAADRRHHGTDTPPEQTQGHSGGNRDTRNGTDTEITEPEREPQGSFSSSLFAVLPERHKNADVQGIYSDTHFRIGKNGYDGSGRTAWEESVKNAYQIEVNDILTAQGWTIVESDRTSTSPTAIKGKNFLYLHPQDFSGVCENTERENLFKAFQNAKTFSCQTVDVYREIHDMTDEQLTEKLNSEREIIEKELLEALTTKRSNLYITDVGYFGVCGNVAKQHSVKRLAIEGKKSFHGEDDTTDGICTTFVSDIFKSLVNEGKIVSSNTRHGTGYRTANKKELENAIKAQGQVDTDLNPEQAIEPQGSFLLPQDVTVLERWRKRTAIDDNLFTMPINSGTVTPDKVDYVSSWLNQNNSNYLFAYVVMYHSRPGNDIILEDGLYPITKDGQRINDFRNGFIPLSNTPEQAKALSDSNGLTDTVIYEVLVPIRKLLPDTELLNNQRSIDMKIGRSLADSLCCSGAMVKGNLEAWQIQKYEQIAENAERITFYSHYKKMPYREGDIVKSLSMSAQLVRITDADVFYKFPDENDDTAIYNMERSRFEGNLENGVYRTITSGDAEQYVGPAQYAPDGTEEPPPTTEQQSTTEPEGTPFWRQYTALMKEYPNCNVFRRLGDFYEVLGEDAKTIADELNLSLVSRDVGLTERVQMIGVPAHTLDDYVKQLIRKGYGVAVAHSNDDVEVWDGFDADKETGTVDGLDEFAIPDEPASYAVNKAQAEQLTLFQGGIEDEQTETPKAPSLWDRYDYALYYEYVSVFSRRVSQNEDYRAEFGKVGNWDGIKASCKTALDREIEDTRELYSTLTTAYNSDPELNKWFSQRVFEESYSLAAKQTQEQKPAPQPQPKTGRTLSHRNYRLFNILFPQITDGTYRYLHLESEGYMPLSVERLGGNQYSIMHTYTQNGDMMRDPDMVIEIDPAEKTIQSISFENSGMGVYQDVYANNFLNERLQRDLNNFFSTWLKNIGEQGFAPARAISRGNDEDIEITFDSQGKPITAPTEPTPITPTTPDEKEPIRLYQELLNSHNGQQDLQIQAFSGKNIVGTLYYSVFEDTPRIENIEVFEDYRRQGIGTAMVRYLANEYPGTEIEWSLLTDDGRAFHDAITYEVENEEHTQVMTRLAEVVEQLERYDTQYNEGDVPIPDDVSENWNSLHDEQNELEQRLPYLFPVKTFIRLDDSEITPETADEQDEIDVSGGMVETPAETPKVKLLPQAPAAPERINYRYSEDDNLFMGGAKTKFRNNIEAIRLMKHLETEGRLATPAEQKILANYVGWGGLSNAFSKTAAGWENEYQELKLMLDEDEYTAAMNSTITAFYTEPKIAEYMHKALGGFGFEGGANRTLVEPALGTGNFFSVLPETLQSTKLYGVELDSITGRIAKQLYQNADIQVQGFETTGFEDGSVDVIIGNIPFNSIKVYDKKYEDENFLIHDYFIAKSLDLLKPGGIAAVITSKGTLDKNDPSARKYFAQRAELIGAIRLPNTAFKSLSGTEVTADILFFQKLDHVRNFNVEDEPDWVYVDGMYTDNKKTHYIRLNQYFIDNPDMVLGEMKRDHSMYGKQDGTACIAPEGQDLYAELETAIGKLSAVFTAQPDPEITTLHLESGESPDEKKIEADEGTKNYTYVVKDDGIFFCEGGYLIPQVFKGIKAERVKGLCEIRSALLDVVDVQSREYQYNELEAAQKKLNEVYDAFVDKYGYINEKANSLVFNNDDQYPLLRSIEDLNNDKRTYSKAPIFTRATIKSYRQPTHAENAKEALEISLNMKLKVDLAYMAYLYEKSEDEIIKEIGDRIYLNPQNYYGNPHEGWETAEEYLSGDVVSKLEYAKLKALDNEMFARNVTALEEVQPVKLLPSDIDFRIGSPWIPIEYFRQFMYETFETPAYLTPTDYTDSNSGRIELEYLEYTDVWRISNKLASHESLKAYQEFGTDRANAYEIYEDCLNMQSTTIRDPVKYRDDNGREQTKYVVNANDTMIARSKQQLIKEQFGTWLFADKDRAEILLNIYNERFNRIRPREYDGTHLYFDGMSEERELRQHQMNVAARIIYHGTCLMAHEVGAGKTAAMIAAGMYMKNMGVIKKPIYVVPNHLTEQWANEFMRFFPSANILVTTKEDFEKKNRNRFVSKIAMGDYDAIIIGHTQFEKIPVSPERQKRLLNQEIATLTRIIEQMKLEKGENWAIKQIVIFQNNLKDRLERLIKEERKDDLLNFEQLGVDYMFVDEAHAYKNCYTYTKMRNVAGIGQSKSQRASDMLMKCQYLQEINKGRGVTFATGTPISNSMSEMYVMQRFLQPDILKKTGLHFFDKWAATFGDTISSLEINPEGSGYRIKNRFSKFHNLPELMKMFRIIADIQTSDMLDLPIPEIEGGKAQVIVTERSAFQKKIMDSFVERADKIRKREVEPEEDNMLKLTNEAKLMAIDPRLVYSDAPNDPNSKLNTCIRNVFDVWKETADERLTQVLFCDSGTPKPGQFNVYDEVKKELIAKGVPADEIAFVHDAKNDAQREAMFEKTRKGEIRVLLGSTAKLGTGTNIQTKLCALHHLDVPWRPSDIIQRDGRGLRFGNENGSIKIFRYVTKDTFDAYLWQIQEQKLRYISQIMTSKSVSRSCEDVDETVLTAAEIKAIATSNPLLAEKMNVDNEVTRLKLIKGNWTNERIVLERNISKNYPESITRSEKRIEEITRDIAVLDKHKGGDFIITIDGKTYDERTLAGEVLMTVINAKCEVIGEGQHHIGSFRGLDLYVERKNSWQTDIRLIGNARYSTTASDSAIGNITRIENLAERVPGFLTETETKLTEIRHQLDVARVSVTKPFEYEEKLSGLLTRQTEINTTLEFKELSKQQDEVLSEGGANKETDEDEVENEYENDGIAV